MSRLAGPTDSTIVTDVGQAVLHAVASAVASTIVALVVAQLFGRSGLCMLMWSTSTIGRSQSIFDLA